MKLLIKNGRVVDPANNIDATLDILVEDKKISRVEKGIKVKVDQTIDATGKIVSPGLIDMHVHLREPGREDKETVKTGTFAALKGGVTSVLAMPNTSPAMDSPENIKLLKGIIKNTANCNVFICGAITKNRAGKELTSINKFAKLDVVAISDDGASVDDDVLFSKALKQAKENKILVIAHSEDKSLSKNGVVNRGIIATRLGLRGISKESEYLRVGRDIKLAQKNNAAIHIAHVSCLESVDIIKKAKKCGVKVTCETAPHYFSLDETAVLDYDTNKKMNPPLRTKEDIEAIKKGLKDSTIDAIASDHAPHTENGKDIEFDRAEFGVIGLETMLSVAITELIEKKILTWMGLIEKLTLNPAKILKLDRGCLSVGQAADITIIDSKKEWVITKENIVSKSKNSAFLEKKLKGAVLCTIVGGEIVYQYK